LASRDWRTTTVRIACRSGELNIALIYDAGADSWSPEDIQAVLDSVNEVERVLADSSHNVQRIAVHADLAWLDEIRGADLVFNLCEGVEGVSQMEYAVTSAIELTGIPYTGCSAWTATICHTKPVLNAVLEARGLPIPRWFVPSDVEPLPTDFDLPAIVKPAAEDASIGIEQASIVTTAPALQARAHHIQRRHGRAFVQRYVDGREIAVGFVGEHTLPLSEIDFTRMPDGAWPIVSFSAKWHEGCDEYAGTEPVCPAVVDEQLAHRIIEVARTAWQTVGGQGYGRVDFRVDANGEPWILEVNPNPDLSIDAGLARMARNYGWSYQALVAEIVRVALDPRTDRAPGTRPPRSVAAIDLREASLT
jgi:D-alanine-D-alanine ligase